MATGKQIKSLTVSRTKKQKIPFRLLLNGIGILLLVTLSSVWYGFIGNNGTGGQRNDNNTNLGHQENNYHDQSIIGLVDSTKDKTRLAHTTTNKSSKPQVGVHPPTVTIGYAVSVTGCGSDPITEGAAVLKHAIHLTSIHGNIGGRYDYQMYAIHHPNATACAAPLKDLGYQLVKRNTPVEVKDIQGDYLRENISKNGCCGEKELIKLEAYTLTQHPIVVHLDLDVVVLKPMDALFDWMLANPEDNKSDYDTSNIPIMWPEKEKPQKVNAFFTRDYNMVNPGREYNPVQGGFLVLRPDQTVYNEFVSIIQKGDFQPNGKNGGWGGKIGLFYGSLTFQGLIPYYYDVLHPNQAVELNRCVYNQMADNPKDKATVNDITYGRCRTNEEECEDCRSRPLDDVVSAHFTLCQKPWLCLPQDENMIQKRLCRKLHHEWYRIRSDLERSWGRSGFGNGNFHKDHFFGYCSNVGKKGYTPIELPYGEKEPKKES